MLTFVIHTNCYAIYMFSCSIICSSGSSTVSASTEPVNVNTDNGHASATYVLEGGTLQKVDGSAKFSAKTGNSSKSILHQQMKYTDSFHHVSFIPNMK